MGRREKFKFRTKKTSFGVYVTEIFFLLWNMGELVEREYHFPSLTQWVFVLTDVVFFLPWSFWAYRFPRCYRAY